MFPNPTEASMNSDHEIEVTEETSAPVEALETASETALDHATAATVEAADHSDDEDGDDEEGDDEDGEESDEDDADADDSVKAEGDDAKDDEESEDDESEEGHDDKEEAA
jgi:DNA-directed RNA polymerase subunit delta